MNDFNNNIRTDKGEHLAGQIEQTVYGCREPLTASDVWFVLDQAETHLMETGHLDGRIALINLMSQWKRQLETTFPDMQTV